MSLIINKLNYLHPNKTPLFQELTLTIGKGEKLALVGSNGAGKSTLLRIIAGICQPSSGDISIPEPRWYIPQHLGQFDNLSVAQALGIDKKLRALHAITNGDTDPQHFTDLEDDWNIVDKMTTALTKWDLGHLSPWDELGRLSGGEKTKVFLAGIDMHEPELILLDEPSNHLDIRSRAKLYDLIRTSRATMLIVSHDRILLDLLSKTLELSSKGIEVYGGNFEFYKQQKLIQTTALQARLDEQSKTLKLTRQKARDMAEQRQRQEARGNAQSHTGSLPRILAGRRKGQAEVSTARLMDAHQEKLTGITDNIQQLRSEILQYQELIIDIGASHLHRGKLLIDAKEINYMYNGQHGWDMPLSFHIHSGDRIHIAGDNGAGKTTLVKIITSLIQPVEGSIHRAGFTHLYLDQDYTMTNGHLTVYEQVLHYNNRHLAEHELKSLLTHAQFTHDTWDRPCAGLSGGEKLKLSLCCLAVNNNTPDMLILDEPTNNLDIQSLDMLAASVKKFNGTLLIISHDQSFIDDMDIDSCIKLK